MSDAVREALKQYSEDPEFKAKLDDATSSEDKRAVLKEHGHELSAEDLQQYREAKELSVEQLESATGGGTTAQEEEGIILGY